MKSLLVKDKQKRLNFQKSEFSRLFLNYLLQNSKVSIEKKFEISQKLQSYSKSSFYTRIKNRCVFTNRGRGILKSLKLSRIRARELINFGLLPGYSKSVW